ncbi:hypothetical protein [Alicyclobacillus sp.]|uniref:hypothetical protein n=1 Tax=Alicyclobacillus sp. TaxID=61169 RepID=UPI0025C37194|nr:hypothetical protein [Alicyclobacillus sp.]MCL6516902.1 hypothetical protein [Alicyclobacillus sp.]
MPHAPPRLVIQSTPWTWHHHPVYRLLNASTEPLTTVHVYSWSEEKLPVLAIGREAPSTIGSEPALQQPPYNLPAGQSLWFVGPDAESDRPFTVTWRDGGRVAWAVVRTSSQAPSVSIQDAAESGVWQPSPDDVH